MPLYPPLQIVINRISRLSFVWIINMKKHLCNLSPNPPPVIQMYKASYCACNRQTDYLSPPLCFSLSVSLSLSFSHTHTHTHTLIQTHTDTQTHTHTRTQTH